MKSTAEVLARVSRSLINGNSILISKGLRFRSQGIRPRDEKVRLPGRREGKANNKNS